MSFEDAYPLRQIAALPADQIGKLYSELMQLIVRLAQAGLIHGDFNEFNLLVRELGADDDSEGGGDGGDLAPPAQDSESEDSVQAHAQVERGNGFERVILPDGAASAPSSESDDDLGDDAITFDDGVQIAPILIDFPQMVSTSHINAEMSV